MANATKIVMRRVCYFQRLTQQSPTFVGQQLYSWSNTRNQIIIIVNEFPFECQKPIVTITWPILHANESYRFKHQILSIFRLYNYYLQAPYDSYHILIDTEEIHSITFWAKWNRAELTGKTQSRKGFLVRSSTVQASINHGSWKVKTKIHSRVSDSKKLHREGREPKKDED